MLLLAQRREHDLEARRRRHPENLADRQRGTRVVELVARRVARLERHVAREPPHLDVRPLQVGLEQRLVGNDRDASGPQRLDQLRLRARDVLDRLDELEVHRADVRDQGDVRLRERREPRDLTEPAHPHLDDAELGVGVDAAERQRHPELVVVVRLGRDRAQVRRAERGEDVLRGRLAGRAGDRDHACGRAVADRTSDRRECRVRLLRDEHRGRTARERVGGEVLAAGDGDEEVALLDPARVDLEAGDLVGPRPCGEAAERLE